MMADKYDPIVKPINFIAKELRQFKAKIVNSKKKYNRKKYKQTKLNDNY